MSTEPVALPEDRTSLLYQRLDELDRLLLGLLPRSERLTLVAGVEARVRELGDNVEIARELPAELSVAAVAPSSSRPRAHRSRLAFSSGVLGIIAAACLVGSPVLFLALSIFGELLGEAFAMLLLGLIALLVTCGGGLAVFCGGVSLFRLARRDQTATGTGWAITGLCTGALPLLIGFVGILSLGAELLPTGGVYVSSTVTPVSGPAIGPDGCPLTAPTMYGTPVPLSADARTVQPMPALLPAQPPMEPAWREPRAEPKIDSKADSKSDELLPAAPTKEPATESVEVED